MDNRAYHLQRQAHQAVVAAINRADLVRQPCEHCGAKAQAHHDSYYPDKWLVVRWLCPKHHREWHDNNEATWPTIFEYHPCDEDLGLKVRNGRPSHPWMRTSNSKWFVTHKGKKVCLGRDRDAAFKKFAELQRHRDVV